MVKKGIVLSGGSATRLAPASFGVSKQLMPIYDKPMIYYPLSLLMKAGIRDILIISTPHDIENFKRLFSLTENLLGINISYAMQPEPNGIAQAFTIGAKFIGNDNIALVLGDSIIYGYGVDDKLKDAAKLTEGATIFGCYVNNPSAYGVVEFDTDFKVVRIEEKPVNPRSNYAIPGLYFYDNHVIEYARYLKPSTRGELEITDINNIYLTNNKLTLKLLDIEVDWFDTGTHESMLMASSYVEAIQQRKGIVIACLEEIAYKNGWIDRTKLQKLANLQSKTGYGKYLEGLCGKNS